MANSSMQTLAWSCDEATWNNHRKLSCRSFTSRHLRIGSKTWGILTILRFIHIWFHVVLGPSSWIIWLGNGNLICSKIQFLHSFNQFKRIRHVPKQTMAKETLLEPHAYRRLRNDMKSTWIPELQSEDTCKQRHLLNVLSAKSPMISSNLFHRLRGVGCFTHLSKTTAFLAVYRTWITFPF